jgi:hypothetical protein
MSARTCAAMELASTPGDSPSSRRDALQVRMSRHESCTCPGAEDKRAMMERQRTPGGDRCGAGQAAGMIREQIKNLYETELRARGPDMPPDALLDAEVSLIVGDWLAATRFWASRQAASRNSSAAYFVLRIDR